jgi:hypothetical protein
MGQKADDLCQAKNHKRSSVNNRVSLPTLGAIHNNDSIHESLIEAIAIHSI